MIWWFRYILGSILKSHDSMRRQSQPQSVGGGLATLRRASEQLWPCCWMYCTCELQLCPSKPGIRQLPHEAFGGAFHCNCLPVSASTMSRLLATVFMFWLIGFRLSSK
mmetsp:Transcript_7273/g.17390  ORF Transcript_7273/g.17390 Transcript_7273/m.17390 type:complete len:108 (+) Transcript_7273:524-847(+)